MLVLTIHCVAKLMKRMEDEYGIVFVVAAGNDGGRIDNGDTSTDITWYPALANRGLAGMMVVAATDSEGFPWAGNSLAPADNRDLVWAMAPGANLPVTPTMRSEMEGYVGSREIEGTSFGKWPRSASDYRPRSSWVHQST